MRGKETATIAAVAATAVLLALVLVFGGGSESKHRQTSEEAVPGQPQVSIVSPRNGARQSSHAVVVKVDIHNFHLAPRNFGGQPQLAEGNIRFSLKRVPDCVNPKKLKKAEKSPVGNGRLLGASYDYPRYSGPNGVLAEQIGSAGGYSPATRPEIFYHNLPPGFYRLIVNLAQNNGAITAFHAVTTFQVLSLPGHGPKPCGNGKVPSAAAAARLG